MSCPGCLIALAGFGDDAVTAGGTPMPAMVGGPAINPQMIDHPLTSHVGTAVLNSLAYVIGGPIVGSIVFTIIGAVAYKSHRVAGGALGFLAGGALGGIIGAYLARRQVESVLPELQGAAASAVDALPDAVGSDGSMNVPSGGFSVGPLKVPAGNIKLPGLIAGQLSVAPSHLIGMLNLAVVQAAKQGQQIPHIKKVPSVSGQQIPHIKTVPSTSSGQAAAAAMASAPSAQQAIENIAAVFGKVGAAAKVIPHIKIVPGSSPAKVIPHIVVVPAPTGSQQIPHIVSVSTDAIGQKVPHIHSVPPTTASCWDACGNAFNLVNDPGMQQLSNCRSKCLGALNQECVSGCSQTYNMVVEPDLWNNCVNGCYGVKSGATTKQVPHITTTKTGQPSSESVTLLSPGQSMSTAQTGCPAGTMRNSNGVCASATQGAMTAALPSVSKPGASVPGSQAVSLPSAASSLPSLW